MSDRHLRRAGSDYRNAFLELLPQGEAWPKHTIDSVLWKACDGLNKYWGFVDGRAADLLEIESDPRTTVELLPDWERNFGLPDPCYTAPQTVAQRQIALVARMTLWGSQSRQWYIDFAAFLGYNITISEYRPWMVGFDRCGDARIYGNGTYMQDAWGRPILNPMGVPLAQGELSEWPNYGLGPPENRYYWTVHVAAKSLEWFRCASGQCGVDPHLRIGIPEDLECILARWKPAHTQIIFDFTGVEGSSLYEVADTAAGLGGVVGFLATGNGAVTEARDTMANTGSISLSGSGGVTEARDTLAGATSGALIATAAITEARDSMASSGTGTISTTTIFQPSNALNQDYADPSAPTGLPAVKLWNPGTPGGPPYNLSTKDTPTDNYYWAQLEPWNTGSLTKVSDPSQVTATSNYYTDIIVYPSTFPAATEINWAFPDIQAPNHVYSYDSVCLGYYVFGSNRPPNEQPRIHPALVQINSLSVLTYTANITLTGQTDMTDFIYDFSSYPTNTIQSGNPLIHEFTVTLHDAAYMQQSLNDMFADGRAVVVTESGRTWAMYCFAYPPSTPKPTGQQILFSRIASSTDHTIQDTLNHTIDIKALLQACVSAGWTNGNGWLVGTGLGPEPVQGRGKAVINSISINWNGVTYP